MKTMLSARKTQALLVLASLLLFQACGLEEVQIPADLIGPSGQGINVKLGANPDWVVADNESQSQVTATVYGPDGRPIAGRGVIFEITNPDGIIALIGELTTITGQQIASGQSATAVTNASGVATVTFSAPARTDILSPTNVLVRARIQGDDYSGARWGTVGIQVLPAEGRTFPPKDTNSDPTCGFVVQPSITPNNDGTYPAGFQILFQSTATDSDGFIARYEWNFGDGTVDLKPDVNHAYAASGSYVVVHVVTDNNGGVSVCPTVTITVK
jgi:hypothetical protein